MAGINKVILVGNLGRDPEIRYAPSGTAVATFTLATTESIPSKDGGREDRTEWHSIVTFGRLAEICGEYLAKGRQVYIEGRLQTREWEDRDGNKRKTTEIVANTMQMLGPPPGGSGGKPRDSRPSAPRGGEPRGGGRNDRDQGPSGNDWGPPPAGDDEIPF